MKFQKYQKQKYSAMERSILEYWQSDDTFVKSVDQREGHPQYVFYDGPPFITGLPHTGTLLASITKDIVLRFKTMQGYQVKRRWGWDCHGLPAENFVESKLGLADKQAVLDYGLEKYIVACRQSMIQTGSEWEETIVRIARWVDFKDAYKTMDREYMESVWWAFKQLYGKGLIYEGHKVLMYCTRCATPISKSEVAMDNSYREITEPSVYVKFQIDSSASQKLASGLKFELDSDSNIYMLAWTTTPWTLPANTALAVNPNLNYSLVQLDSDYYVCATDLTEKIFTDQQGNQLEFKKVGEFSGNRLEGTRYQPLIEDHGGSAHRILLADYATAEEGTGVIHIAPAYGEEDYQLALENDLPVVANVDDLGIYTAGPWQSESVWQVDKKIVQYLSEADKLFKAESWRHNYPHCHRCQTKLMYKVHKSWFMDIASQKDKLLEHNQAINWSPNHFKDGRFAKVVEAAPDWNLSRDRFWATPMPVWQGRTAAGEVKTIVVGSYQELEDLSQKSLDDYHRPWVDEITFVKDGVEYRRLDKVLDCWFESGSMPFAQYHYPFENKQVFEDSFPADYITEYVGQVRTWFYYLHVISVALFSSPAFKNVIVTGTILGSDSRKISKSLGNYTDPMELLDLYSADAYRLVLTDSVVMQGEDYSLIDKDVLDKQRKLETLRNVLEFFLLYAQADDWQAGQSTSEMPVNLDNQFDIWILACLSKLNSAITHNLENYTLNLATQPLMDFIDDLSNWYVRRNRKRFWKAVNDDDKDKAYHTLYFVLLQTARLIAPICPFIAEEIHQNLSLDKGSVHLEKWPEIDSGNDDLVNKMSLVRRYVSEGLALRAQLQIKVRQPLAKLAVSETDKQTVLTDFFIEIIKEELNVKQVEFQFNQPGRQVQLDTELTPELKQEGMVREIVRLVQASRKEAGLEVENRIELSLQFDDDFLAGAIDSFGEYLKTETLAVKLHFGSRAPVLDNHKPVNFLDKEISLSFNKI